MNVRKHYTIGLALTGLALGLSTFKGNAQQGLNGPSSFPRLHIGGTRLCRLAGTLSR